MIINNSLTTNRAKAFREKLTSGATLRFPGAFNPLCAKLIEQIGFDGVYISGAVLSNELGYPDIGMTTLTEVATRGGQIAKATELPCLIDADTGFGETMNVVRTIQELEAAGLAGCHLEDQINPKRCGHLDHKSLVEPSTMLQKIRAAVRARRNGDFVIMARTDSKATEGIDKAIDRAKAYVDAGADMIFPEALHTHTEFAQFRKAITVPILANMTEFGKSELLNIKDFEELGVNLVIYPVTSLRLAMRAVELGLQSIKQEGDQKSQLAAMQHRKELYDLLGYEDYNSFDRELYNFTIEK